MIHNRPSQISQGSPRGGKDHSEVQPPPRTLPIHSRDWEMESTSSESKSSSSSKYRPTWRPKRESLNIDSIFNKEKRKQCGYTQLSPFSEDAGKIMGWDGRENALVVHPLCRKNIRNSIKRFGKYMQLVMA